MKPIPRSWQPVLAAETQQDYFLRLAEFVGAERERARVFPPEAEVFNALELTPFERVRVLILGQDPYHDEGQAEGLAFSVRMGVPPPPSLVNVYKELHADVGFVHPGHGHLAGWAEQGVLLLNAVLTVRAHEPNSHRGKGWERFTDRIITALSERDEPLVFLLWGGYAQKKLALIDEKKHAVLTAAHPSPLSAHRGFFCCRHFSKSNARLREWGLEAIEWQLPI